MKFTTTISQKGQIVVPKKIRDQLNLQPSDVLQIMLENNAIVAKPVLTTDEAFGMIQAKRPATKRDIKQAVKSRVTKKFKNDRS